MMNSTKATYTSWKMAFPCEDDWKMREWIWTRTIGKTEKGDSLEFVVLKDGSARMTGGLLKGADGIVKCFIPAAYEDEEIMVDYKETDMDEVLMRLMD